MKKLDPLILNIISRRIEAIRPSLKEARVSPGWIAFMRTALGMTFAQLGKRAGLAPSTVHQAEKREAEGKVTLDTLVKLAHAMDCEFTYAFVPKKEISEYLDEVAEKKARQIVQKSDTHMSLEDQKVEGDIEERIQRLKEKIKGTKEMWS